MTAIEHLLRLSTAATGEEVIPPPGNLSVSRLLQERNGFFAFDLALEVFPATKSDTSYSIGEWNERCLWRGGYEELDSRELCFAQDIFGEQFVISDRIYKFDPESAAKSFLADSLEEWAELILTDSDILTGRVLAREWQDINGSLPVRTRLLPLTPFILGGEFSSENLVAVESAKAMKIRSYFCNQLKDLPEGSEITYRIID